MKYSTVKRCSLNTKVIIEEGMGRCNGKVKEGSTRMKQIYRNECI